MAGPESQRLRYPGLIQIESRLWRAFLLENEGQFHDFEYNVRVGEGISPGNRVFSDNPELNEKLRNDWRDVTRKRIDVVAREGPATWIFEVEERLGVRALGNLLLYETLLPKKRELEGPLFLAVVTRRMGPDMREAVERAQARVFTTSERELDRAIVEEAKARERAIERAVSPP